MTIELITAINNSNLKTRKLAEDVFKSISAILSHFNAVPQLFQLLLVGLAGTSPQMQSSTIRALIFNLKLNLTLAIELDGEQEISGKKLKVNKLLAGSETVQDFLKKVTRIVALFLKDPTAPKELQRSVLKFLKITITFMQVQGAGKQMAELIITHVFSLPNPEKYTMMIRKILNKLIARIGVTAVTSMTSPKHQKLIKYVERARKKVVNARQRKNLLALIGEEDNGNKEVKTQGDSDSDIEDFSDDNSGNERMSDQEMNHDSIESESESDEEEDELAGTDALQSSAAFDIPYVAGIPVFSQLAKDDKKSKEEKAQDRKIAKSKKINNVI